MTNLEYIRQHLLSALCDIESLSNHSLEWVKEHRSVVHQFEVLRRNRLVQGWFRYHHDFSKSAGEFDAIQSAINRLKAYQKTGNQECLVDAANLCAIEFALPTQEHTYFESGHDGEHVEKL